MAQRITNSLTGNPNQPKTFSQAIQGRALQDLIAASVADDNARARFTATLVSVVAASYQLQNCTPATIVAAALRGEGMGLTYGQGYYVVPYGKSATFIMSAKGYIQLAVATGQLADIDCVEVREGELVGRNPKNKRPEFDFSIYKTDEESEAHPIIGYLAYFETKSGFYRSEYWPCEKLLKHADRYSSAFSLEKYNKMMRGELSADEVAKAKRGSQWYDVGGNQEAMMKKTAMRSLLNSGYLNLANCAQLKNALDSDTVDGVIPDLGLDTYADVQEPEQETQPEVVEGEVVEQEAPKKKRETSKERGQAAETDAILEEESVESFFDV